MEITHTLNSNLFFTLLSEPAQDLTPLWVSIILLIKLCSTWSQSVCGVNSLHFVLIQLDDIILKDKFFFSIVFLELGGVGAYLPRSGEKGKVGRAKGSYE